MSEQRSGDGVEGEDKGTLDVDVTDVDLVDDAREGEEERRSGELPGSEAFTHP